MATLKGQGSVPGKRVWVILFLAQRGSGFLGSRFGQSVRHVGPDLALKNIFRPAPRVYTVVATGPVRLCPPSVRVRGSPTFRLRFHDRSESHLGRAGVHQLVHQPWEAPQRRALTQALVPPPFSCTSRPAQPTQHPLISHPPGQLLVLCFALPWWESATLPFQPPPFCSVSTSSTLLVSTVSEK